MSCGGKRQHWEENQGPGTAHLSSKERGLQREQRPPAPAGGKGPRFQGQVSALRPHENPAPGEWDAELGCAAG